MNAARPGTLTLWNRMKGKGGRGDRSALGMWFWDIDRLLLLLALLLMAVGLIAVGAASPAAAVPKRLGCRCPGANERPRPLSPSSQPLDLPRGRDRTQIRS